MKIGLDLDDVVFDTVPSFLGFYNQIHGTNFTRTDITMYEIEQLGIGKTPDDVTRLFDRFHTSPEFDRIPLVEGAEEGIFELSRLPDSSLVIVTSRPPRYRAKTTASITRSFPNNPLPVYFSYDFSFNNQQTRSQAKSQICRELGVDVFVEDYLVYAQACSEQGVRVLLLDKPWNQNGTLPSNITRVYKWQEILQQIKGDSNALPS